MLEVVQKVHILKSMDIVHYCNLGNLEDSNLGNCNYYKSQEEDKNQGYNNQSFNLQKNYLLDSAEYKDGKDKQADQDGDTLFNQVCENHSQARKEMNWKE